MGGRENKFGLKDSDLKEEQKKKIRRDAGYGCVICGALFIQYEHIEPEFHEAKEHDPDKMTLLCGSHHDDVSHSRITKQDVWRAKENPKNKQGDSIYRDLYHQKNNTNIIIGDNSIGAVVHKIFDSILTIRNKPVLWFEQGSDPESPIEVCAIFHGLDGLPHAYINRNCFTTVVADYDIKGKGPRVTISDGKKVILILNFEGGKTLKIERINMSYKDSLVEVKTNKKLCISIAGNTTRLNRSQVGTLYLGEASSTRHMKEGCFTALALATKIAVRGKRIVSYNGSTIGWVADNVLFNKSYFVVGIQKDSEGNVCDTTGEYLGFISETRRNNDVVLSLVMSKDSYDTGEPIWIIPVERSVRNVKNEHNYDLGYRIFGDQDSYFKK
ncbi:TPA: hypothetical protein ACXIWS_003627 [Klebsiella pneumoniae]|uniref:hypothetical protein n=1 Tax=Klebsiella pneumoniae TaxID=573 RepID=UPI002F964876|nr:hypothetical protein [Klebsiella pneumoniae]HBR0438494.1 hypothetical protein [Klebsiella pneumoniae]HDK5760839.1 hypothetical protein [Klebsiella pneumoniae]